MARIRTVKPSFFTSETTTRLTFGARLTLLGLLTHADDDGRFVDNPLLVKAAVWPLDEDVAGTDVDCWLNELVTVGLLHRYEADSKRYAHVRGFTEHQRINRKTDSVLPPPPEGSCLPHGVSSEPVVSVCIGKGKEGKGKEGKERPSTDVDPVAVKTSQKKAKGPTDPDTGEPLNDRGFPDFYDIYPERSGKKVGKARALGYWRKLELAERKAAYVGARHYATAMRLPGAVSAKDPDRWLRDRCWDDWQDGPGRVDDPNRPRSAPAVTCQCGQVVGPHHKDEFCTQKVTA